MTETEVQQKRSAVLFEAFERAAENCGNKGRMLAALGITESWMYALRSGRGSMTAVLALKLQTLTHGEFKWHDLCPEEYERIQAVTEYLVK